MYEKQQTTMHRVMHDNLKQLGLRQQVKYLGDAKVLIKTLDTLDFTHLAQVYHA